MKDNDLFELIGSVLNVPSAELNLQSGPDNIQSWDSLGHVTLCTALEQMYKIQLTMSEMLGIRSVDDIKKMLNKYGF